MSEKVQCAEHGEQQPCFVCTDIVDGMRADRQVGFVYVFAADGPDTDEPCAWCDECEDFRASVGGWDPHDPPRGIKIVCRECFERVRLQNGGGRQVQ